MKQLPQNCQPNLGYTIHGERYVALSDDGRIWTIRRGRFNLGRFIGTAQEAKLEVIRWDETAKKPTIKTGARP